MITTVIQCYGKMTDQRIQKDVEECGHCPAIIVVGLRISTGSLREDKWTVSQDLILGHPEYGGVLHTW
jgi:hypothetical protein